MHAAAVFLNNGGEVIVRMRGLPFDAKVSDIVSLFFLFVFRFPCVGRTLISPFQRVLYNIIPCVYSMY